MPDAVLEKLATSNGFKSTNGNDRLAEALGKVACRSSRGIGEAEGVESLEDICDQINVAIAAVDDRCHVQGVVAVGGAVSGTLLPGC